MDLIFCLGGITTSGDELSPQYLALFAESIRYSQCSSLLRKPDCKPQSRQGGSQTAACAGINNNPEPLGAARGFTFSLLPCLPVPWHPPLAAPSSTPDCTGETEPSPALQSLWRAWEGREGGQRCLLRRVQISLAPHFNATLWDHSSSLQRGSHFTGKP